MEKLFWSIALPDLGQLLNGKYLKGVLFILLEFSINIQANFIEAILLSFHGILKKQSVNKLWMVDVLSLSIILCDAGCLQRRKSWKTPIFFFFPLSL
ncbi:hypothetical protein [Bacillus sp. FSL K6-3431]|uniref:hypothetical protein n=1 Tax=Bacillus sp. FSL K6-3431 TaxID=2921500 RepID=UPI0030F5E4D7